MRKNKKAISPLIATVLIIGFTIVLAGLVMQWGSTLVKTMKEESTLSSEYSLKCSTILSGLKIKSAGYDGYGVRLSIENNGQEKIDGGLFRLYSDKGNIYLQNIEPIAPIIKPFAVEQWAVSAADIPAGEKAASVEMLPVIKLSNNKSRICGGGVTADIGVAGESLSPENQTKVDNTLAMITQMCIKSVIEPQEAVEALQQLGMKPYDFISQCSTYTNTYTFTKRVDGNFDVSVNFLGSAGFTSVATIRSINNKASLVIYPIAVDEPPNYVSVVFTGIVDLDSGKLTATEHGNAYLDLTGIGLRADTYPLRINLEPA